jgi:hypothetical protein
LTGKGETRKRKENNLYNPPLPEKYGRGGGTKKGEKQQDEKRHYASQQAVNQVP